MQDFAWDLLRDVHHRQAPHYIFYAFSNGGCFVWEQVRDIFHAADTNNQKQFQESDIETLNEEQRKILTDLKGCTAGVIFDSCPSKQLALLGIALSFCTWKERWEVARTYGMDVVFFPNMVAQYKKDIANLRGITYYRGLKDDPWEIPQLYMCSESDMLIPSNLVEDLAYHRRDVIGKDRIFLKKWETSRHCAHYIDHPNEYEATLDAFLHVCSSSTPKSKL